MTILTVFGRLSADELSEALVKHFVNRPVRILTNDKHQDNPSCDDIVICLGRNEKELQAELAKKTKEAAELEITSSKALASIQTFHQQQQALFDEFVLLRQRYDEQKTALVNILWTHCGQHHPELRQIPMMEDETTFQESDTSVGNFIVGNMLGEGQFATVRTCWKEDNDDVEYALKIIKKERIASFAALKRVSNEIDILRKLGSPFIVTIIDVVQTQSKLYIVTEKGGADLFEFFDEHADGVPELWAKDIITCVLKAVLYCHEQGICHRDLKPENILLTFDAANNRCLNLKLCDFGLSTRYKPNVQLTDFCGSPGFFAPEMITRGAYFGDKADLWSVGCILLELVLGHERFCDIWMNAYDFEILQDKTHFAYEIQAAVERLPKALQFSEELNEFILKFLKLRSSERPTTRTACTHSWLGNAISVEPGSAVALNSRTAGLITGAAANCPTPSPFSPGMSPRRGESLDQSALRNIYMDDRERRHIEEYNQHVEAGEDSKMHLPPIEPATPSIVKLRKMLNNGNDTPNGISTPHLSFDANGSPVREGSGGGGGGGGSRLRAEGLPGLAEGDEHKQCSARNSARGSARGSGGGGGGGGGAARVAASLQLHHPSAVLTGAGLASSQLQVSSSTTSLTQPLSTTSLTQPQSGNQR